jgi:hypothetical protein
MSTHDMADQRRQRRRDDRRRGRGGAGEGLYPRHLLGAVPLRSSWELVTDPLRFPRTWSSLLNTFRHPASESFLLNADRRLRDARARQPSRIFRRRLNACSRRRGKPAPKL